MAEADSLLSSVVCTISRASEYAFLGEGRSWRRQNGQYTLLLTRSGRAQVVVGRGRYALASGIVLLLPPRVAFGPDESAEEGGGRRARVIEVEFSARLQGLLDMPALYGLPVLHRLTRGSMEKVGQAAWRIVYDLGRGRPGYEMAVNSHCLFILSFLWRDIVERGEAATRGGDGVVGGAGGSGERREVRAADVARLAPVLRAIE
ncbi:MAG TPA: hypothetical protein VFN74_06430, partial [Chloroflexota bacterium]|nr:hypothetical protein [Chloroflexota bacterium]